MWTMSTEHEKICKSYTADSRVHRTHANSSNSEGMKKGMMLHPSIRIRRLDIST